MVWMPPQLNMNNIIYHRVTIQHRQSIYDNNENRCTILDQMHLLS